MVKGSTESISSFLIFFFLLMKKSLYPSVSRYAVVTVTIVIAGFFFHPCWGVVLCPVCKDTLINIIESKMVCL